MAESTQTALGVETEQFSKREEELISLLEEHYTIDEQIAIWQARANGDDLIHEPRITAAPPVEDVLERFWQLKKEGAPLDAQLREMESVIGPLSEKGQLLVDVVKKHIDGNRFGEYFFTYHAKKDKVFRRATFQRVADILQETYSEDKEEEEILQAFYVTLREAQGEEAVPLTKTEQLAIVREDEIAMARLKLRTLKAHKSAVSYALSVLEVKYAEYHKLLWNKYVLGKRVTEVCELLGNGSPLTEREYGTRRKKALVEMDRFCWVRL